MAKTRSPREVFLALVNGIADGDPGGLPELYAEQIDVTHPFDPLRGAPFRSREDIREGMEQRRAAGSATSRSTKRPTPRSSSPSSNTREPTPPESRTRCPPSS
jgi:ketosteroid isomerase-like protein